MNDGLTIFFSALAYVSVPVLVLVVELFVISRLVRLINRLTAQRLGQFFYLLIMWPGVVVHELSHAAACVFTRTRIVEVKLFSPHRTSKGNYVLGYVKHEVPWSRTVRLLIGTAPFFGGTIALVLILNLLFPESFRSFWRTVLASGLPSWPVFFEALRDWAKEVPSGLFGFGALQYVGVYLMVSVAAHVAPSAADLRGSVKSLVLITLGLCVIFGVLSAFSVEAAYAAAAFGRGFFTVMVAVMGLGLVLVSLATLLVSLVTAPMGLLSRYRQRHQKML